MELPLSEFYKHKQMKDGHLNKCKDCARMDTRKLYYINSQNEEWIKKERLRGREKDRKNPHRESKKKTQKAFGSFNITSKLKKLGIETNGKEAHHWNYNKPLSIILLSRKAHHRIHKKLVVNYNDKYLYTLDGVRLDTKEKTQEYYENVFSKYTDINECIDFVELN